MPHLLWPLLGQERLFPDEPGRFAALREADDHDAEFHTGVDLYGEIGQAIIAMEDGEVVLVEPFTGEHVSKKRDRSKWWNNTWAVYVEGASGVIVYGEIRPCVTPGQRVSAGEIIGHIIPVLRKFKGRPMVMLHLELLRHGTRRTYWWKRGRPQPKALLNPTPLLLAAARGLGRTFDLDFYDGLRFRDPNAPIKIKYDFGSRLQRP